MSQCSIQAKTILLFAAIFVLLFLSFAVTMAGSGFINGWSLTAPLPEPVASAQVVAVNGMLYSIGGQNVNAPTANIFSAVIQDGDGALPQWQAVTPSLPKALYLHTVVNVGNRIFSLGGYDGELRYSSVYSSTVGRNGELSEWQVVNDLPRKLVLHTAVVAPNSTNSGHCIFVLGGWGEDEKPLASVYSSAIDTNSVSLWQELKPLPEPRFRAIAASYQNSVTHQSFVYLLGGFDGKETKNEIYFAKIKAGCELEDWQKNRQLAHAVHYQATVQYGGRLFVLGGKNEAGPINGVFSAPIQVDGTLGEWEKEPDLPLALFRFAALTASPANSPDTFVYLLGGLYGEFFQSQVYRAALPSFKPTATPTPTLSPTASPMPSPTATDTPSPTPTPGFTTLLLLAESKPEVLSGETITYTVLYINGAQTLERVLLFNLLPVNTQLLSNSNNCFNSAQTLVCSLSDAMPAFTTDFITYTVRSQKESVVNDGACIKWQFLGRNGTQCSNSVTIPPPLFLPLISK